MEQELKEILDMIISAEFSFEKGWKCLRFGDVIRIWEIEKKKKRLQCKTL